MINQRLFDHYGIDTTKDLKIATRCGRPWDTLLIDRNGSCYVCECTAWLPYSIGNIQIQPLSQILGNARHREAQQTITDHTYRLCNQSQCAYLQEPEGVQKGWREQQHFTVRLAVDDSCNLRCPSCRPNRIFVSRGQLLTRRKAWIDQIVEWIEQQQRAVQVVIGSDGDPFASLVYRYFMRQAEQKKWSHVTYSFQTNGQLLRKMYSKYPWIFSKLEVLNISIDGSTAEVYERLRLGGSFQTMIDNLQFMANTPVHDKVKLQMVVQQDNWRQMPDILQMIYQYNFDQVHFNLIQDWNVGQNHKQLTEFTATSEYKQLRERLWHDPRAQCYNLP